MDGEKEAERTYQRQSEFEEMAARLWFRRINIFITSNEHYQIITLLLLFKSLVYSTA